MAKAWRSARLNAGGPPVSTPLLRRVSMKLRMSSKPSQAYGIHLARLITKKKKAMVAVNFSGDSFSGIT